MWMYHIRGAIKLIDVCHPGTYPDIMFAVLFLSQFMQNPDSSIGRPSSVYVSIPEGTCEHILAIGKCGALLWNGKTHTGFEGYCDANWESQEHKHLMLGYIFMIDSGWSCPGAQKRNQWLCS